MAAVRLIHCFDTDIDLPGFTRGCPDFYFTVLTYAAVSLLRTLQAQFATLEPKRDIVLHLARKAADILGRSAATPEHLPASQASFLSRLIEIRAATEHSLPAFERPAIDFEAFGNSLDQEQSISFWPPVHSPLVPQSQQGQQYNVPFDFNSLIDSGLNAQIPPMVSNLASWSGYDHSYAVPGAAMGLSVGSFVSDQEMMFPQVDFW